MADEKKIGQDFNAKIAELEERLYEAEDTLRAIRSGEVDALVVSGPEGDRVYTLKGAEYTYRILVESMNEGALFLTHDGTIIYANASFSKMLGFPLERIISTQIQDYVLEGEEELCDALLGAGKEVVVTHELCLKKAKEGECMPAYVSFAPMLFDDTQAISVVVTDLTERKRTEEELAQYREHLEGMVQIRTEELETTNEELHASMAEVASTNQELEVRAYALRREAEERKRAEEALRKSEQYFRSIYDSTQDAVLIVDDDGMCLSANPAVENIFGLTQTRFVHRRISDFVEDGFDFKKTCVRLKQSGKFTLEHKLIAADGVIKTVESFCIINMFPGQHLFVIHDVTAEVSLRNKLSNQLTLLQRALVPPTPRDIEGYVSASAYIPAFAGQEIGGDFYDMFTTETGLIGILIGDVSGKGIEAASLAVSARNTVRAFAYDSPSPADVLEHANTLLATQQVDVMQFVTSFLVVLNPETGDICYSGAGHPPAIIFRSNGEVEILMAKNVPLGVLDRADYKEFSSVLKPGDKLVLYTDGISEARHETELFGTEGIERVLAKYGDKKPDELVKRILDATNKWSHGKLRDDTAIVIVECENHGQERLL